MGDRHALDEEFVQDPYALYEKLREQGPIHPVTMPRGSRAWLITRYDEARTALADSRLHKNFRHASGIFERNRERTRC